MDDSKFCRKCGRARILVKPEIKSKKSPLNIDNLEFDNINLDKEIDQPKKTIKSKPIVPPKTTKNEGKKQINNFFHEKAEVDHAASNQYLSPPPVSNTID